jgi:multiple stress resistance protein BhsA
MKNVKYAVAAIALSALSFGSFAAEQVSSAPAGQREVGVITANAEPDVTSVASALADKAAQSGAKSYHITSITGSNELHGTAEIYQ